MFGIPLIESVAILPRLTAPGDLVTMIDVTTVGASVDGLAIVDFVAVVVVTIVVTGGGTVSGSGVVGDFVVVIGFVVVTGSVIGTTTSAVFDDSVVRNFCVVVIDFSVKTFVV